MTSQRQVDTHDLVFQVSTIGQTMTTEVSDTQSVHIIFIERDFISTTIGQMSGEHISTTWWIGLEYKNDTNDPNKWLWLDGKPVDASIT